MQSIHKFTILENYKTMIAYDNNFRISKNSKIIGIFLILKILIYRFILIIISEYYIHLLVFHIFLLL